MENHDIKNDHYKKHLEAIDAHKSLMDNLHAAEAKHSVADLKASIERIAITLEEYLKIIGLP